MMNTKMNEALAEVLGIIVGDGHLSRYISLKRTHYKVSVFGHRQDDLDYFKEIQDLFESVLGKRPILKNRSNCIELRLNSKEILEKLEELGVPVGKKSGIVRIPASVWRNQNFCFSFLRGLADCDFSVVLRGKNKKLRITADIKSKALIEDCCKVLEYARISFNGPYERNRKRNESFYRTYQLDILGENNLKTWMEKIGFRNQKHLQKIKKREE